MKKKLILIALILAVAIGGVTTVVFALMNKDSKDAPSWQEKYDLGVRYLSTGNYKEAIIAFNAAIEINQKNADIYIGLADAYLGLGDIDGAVEVLTEALSSVHTSERDRIETKLAEIDHSVSPEPMHTHVWLDATCTEPKTCIECGTMEGEPLGHDMQPATTDVPSTCSRCGYTEGEPLTPNIKWSLENGILTISGTGPMENYYLGSAPWSDRENEIEKVVIEYGVTTIGGNAFGYCYSLTNIVISSSVAEISDDAFLECEKLKGITVEEENSNYVSVDGVLFSKDMTLLHTYPVGNGVTEYIIPSGVTTIGPFAFDKCYSLASVIIPDSVTIIGYEAFTDCDNLKSIVIPSSVTEIGVNPFIDCNLLEDITVEEGNSNYLSVEGVLFSKDMALLYTYPVGKGVTEYVVPSGVTTIGEVAFFDSADLTSIAIPDSVTTIEFEAFGYCKNLTTIVISDSVTMIGQSAFEGCDRLTDIYYGGTAEQWNAITADTGISENITIHYNYSR